MPLPADLTVQTVIGIYVFNKVNLILDIGWVPMGSFKTNGTTNTSTIKKGYHCQAIKLPPLAVRERAAPTTRSMHKHTSKRSLMNKTWYMWGLG